MLTIQIIQAGQALDMSVVGLVLLTLLLAAVVSFAITPLVKAFSVKVGAIDVPKDNRSCLLYTSDAADE